MSAARGPRSRMAVAARTAQLCCVLIILGLWGLATAYWGVSPLLLPPPGTVLRELADVLATGEFLDDLRVTLAELAIAFATAATAGLVAGYLISRSGYRIRVLEPLLAGAYAIPLILFLPLYVLCFGLGP